MYNIGFVGKAGAGKTYLSKYLVKHYQYLPAKMATSIYGIAKQYFGMDETNKDRKLLQVLGTDVARNQIDTDIWVKRFAEDTEIVKRTYQKLYNKNVNFCSDDTRFVNEFDILSKNNWILVYLAVPEEIRRQRLIARDGDAQESTLNHISEKEIDIFKDKCYQLDASGSLETTYRKLEEFLEFLRQETPLTNNNK